MIKGIQRVLDMNKKIRLSEEAEFDEENRLIVNLTVKNDDGFLSPFSYDGQPILSAESAEFLSNSFRPKNYRNDIHIKIHSDCIDDNEKVLYTQAIHNYFNREYLSDKYKMRRNLFAALLMLLAGVIFLVAMVICDYYEVSGITIEIIDIFAWVFLWETADLFFLQRHVDKWLQHKNIGFANAKITFGAINNG